MSQQPKADAPVWMLWVFLLFAVPLLGLAAMKAGRNEDTTRPAVRDVPGPRIVASSPKKTEAVSPVRREDPQLEASPMPTVQSASEPPPLPPPPEEVLIPPPRPLSPTVSSAPEPPPLPPIPPDPRLVEAEGSIQCGPALVELLGLGIGTENPFSRQAKPQYVVKAALVVTNTSSEPIQYTQWVDASLVDNTGKSHPMRPALARKRQEMLDPGKIATAVLAFEVPPEEVEYVDLVLPEKNVSGSETESVRFRFLGNMVKRRD